MNSIKIEIAGEQDSEVIREIYQTAFPEEESAMVAKLAVELLAEKSYPKSCPWLPGKLKQPWAMSLSVR